MDIIGSLVIRECMHLFTLPEDPVMVMRCRHSQDRASTPSALRKIKPQRAQRITESCYFYLSPPLCHSVSSVVFQKTLFRKYQKSPGFWSPQREITQASTTESLPKTHKNLMAIIPQSSQVLETVISVCGIVSCAESWHAPHSVP